MSLMDAMKGFPGETSLYYENLYSGEVLEYNADLPLIAASIIKIPIMVEAFRRFEAGEDDPAAIHVLKNSEKMPSCGILNRMHEGVEVTIRDLVEMMIVLSDNTATNILIERYGTDSVNRTMQAVGASDCILRRKLFDAKASAAGIQNTVTARSVATLLKKLYRAELLGKKPDTEMMEILLNQRLNGKFPFELHSRNIQIAHKTGEDDGITHDAAVIFAKQPFVLCMFSNKTDVPSFERYMQETALRLCEL